MAERQEAGAGGRDKTAAVFSLLTGALVWGIIWYPYRVLRDAGIDGVFATTLTYTVAALIGFVCLRTSLQRLRPSWSLAALALAAALCNLGYVLATLSGEVVRVLLLFYLAPLWTVLLSRVLLKEKLNRFGAFVVTLSLAGAATILWRPGTAFPVPHDAADWLGLGAGFSFALFNVLSRYTESINIETKSLVSFVGVVVVGACLLGTGVGSVQWSASPAMWVLVGILGVVLMLANLIVQYGLARVSSNRAIVIMLSEVGFAALSSWLLADETIGLREWAGGAMIVAASVFSAKMESTG